MIQFPSNWVQGEGFVTEPKRIGWLFVYDHTPTQLAITSSTLSQIADQVDLLVRLAASVTKQAGKELPPSYHQMSEYLRTAAAYVDAEYLGIHYFDEYNETPTTAISTDSAKETPMTIKFDDTTSIITFRVPVTLSRADLHLAIAGWAYDVNEGDATQAILSIANPNLVEVEGWVRNSMTDFGKKWVEAADEVIPATLTDLARAMVERLFPSPKAKVNDPANPGQTKVVNLVPDPDSDTTIGDSAQA